jgi:glycosyltransferase involved in cell wall biosynthesis
MNKLSVAIITKNEEHNIGRCLNSVIGLADEIVVLDSGSADRTQEICSGFGVAFFTHPFQGHIEQKNLALSYCSSDHVLSLDADEALSPMLFEAILKEKGKGFKEGYSMNRRTQYCGKWIRFGGWYPDSKTRLVNRKLFAWGGTNPHDRLTATNDAVSITHLKGDLLHYSINSLDEHRKVVDNFSSIAAKAMFTKGKKTGPVKKFTSAVFRFLQSYVFFLGFLEGWHGWQIARLSAKAKYLKYKKLEDLHAAKSQPQRSDNPD